MVVRLGWFRGVQAVGAVAMVEAGMAIRAGDAVTAAMYGWPGHDGLLVVFRERKY